MKTKELVAYLDDYLLTKDVPDYSEAYNGLQVEGKPGMQNDSCRVDSAAQGGLFQFAKPLRYKLNKFVYGG